MAVCRPTFATTQCGDQHTPCIINEYVAALTPIAVMVVSAAAATIPTDATATKGVRADRVVTLVVRPAAIEMCAAAR